MRLGNRTIDPRRLAHPGRRRSARGPGEPAAHVRAPAPTPPAPADHAAERRAKRAGGPQDKALYVCGCGAAFHATVSASVRCPHCGDSQAW